MMESQRDVFFNNLLTEALQDSSIFLLSADMGAPSLDEWKFFLPHRCINTGVAEANTIGMATGLAKLGNIVYVYSITPFITSRCYEQIKLGPCLHNLPVIILGMGAGFSYSEAGPTHHALEDLQIMSALPNLQIVTITDTSMAEFFAHNSPLGDGPMYIRLDRTLREPIYERFTKFKSSLAKLNWDWYGKVPVVLTYGDMVHRIKHADIPILDMYMHPFNQEELRKILLSSDYPYIIVEESTGYLFNLVVNTVGYLPLEHLRVAEMFKTPYLKRYDILESHELDLDSLLSVIYQWVKN